MAMPKYEDVIMKRVMESFAQSGLRFLGIMEEVVQPAETEVVMLELQDLLMDYTFLLKDGNYLHLEFQSTDKGEKDLRRFRKYEALLSDKKGKDVYTYVVYTNDIKDPQTGMRTGFNEYHVKAVRLADWDSGQVLGEIKEALANDKMLDEEQITALAFVPVMSHSADRATVISEAVRISHKLVDSQKKATIQSILFAFANKFLDDVELARIKEEIVMTQLGQMIYEDGIQEGIKTGIATGIKTGIKEGEEKGKIKVAKALLDIMLDEAIAERAELPLELVEKLRRESVVRKFE